MAIKTLHIVDGESTGGSLRQAGFGKKGDILPWRDALYTGPVPRGLTLRRLSRLRSRFWTGKSATEFDKRDATLTHHTEYDEIVLWFGATSICQLSLVQLLAWFDEHSRDHTGLRLVSAYGGWLRPEQLLQAYAARKPITPAQKRLGRRVWVAFCSSSPKALSHLLTTDLRVLPEIRDTITSMLQEYPERQSGLSRLERKLLRTVDSLGVTSPAANYSELWTLWASPRRQRQLARHSTPSWLAMCCCLICCVRSLRYRIRCSALQNHSKVSSRVISSTVLRSG